MRIAILFAVAPFVPSDFIPSGVSLMDADQEIILLCPFKNAGNPPPICTWSRFDNHNISYQLILNNRNSHFRDQYNCSLMILFREDDNGLYQCTGHNEVGNTTYTFPKRFIVESG